MKQKILIASVLIAIFGFSNAQERQEEIIDCAFSCPIKRDPQCGSDGITYLNPCRFKCAQEDNPKLELVNKGVCRPLEGCVCPEKIYRPLCGSDRRTYGNQCEFDCAQKKYFLLRLDHEGECIPCSSYCDFTDHSPVCGSNGVEYAGECNLNCHAKQNPELYLSHTGQCHEPACSCHKNWNPVCGSNGKTYGNDCIFQCAKKEYPFLKIAYRGECRAVNQTEEDTCTCTDDYTPVCGTDGVTYGNLCAFLCAQRKNPELKLAYPGECRVPPPDQPGISDTCTCPLVHNVIEHCGTDGTTYASLCHLKCAQRKNPDLKLNHIGNCPRADVNCVCPSAVSDIQIEERCGTDGRNYKNPCQLNCAMKTYPQLQAAHKGYCLKAATPSNCTCVRLPPNEVCGTDGVTYSWYCYLECAQKSIPDIKLEHVGKCQPGDDDFIDCGRCSSERNPQCGSDGVTYQNTCRFRCAQLANPELKLVNKGVCHPVADCICPAKIYKPLCGTDGRQYGNQCEFDCAQKKYPLLKKDYDGECQQCSLLCDFADDSPVCGSDGVTYAGRCRLECASKQKNPEIYLVHTGQCHEPSCPCPKIQNPVCGSNGKTYANDCIFECAKKEYPILKIAYRGECRAVHQSQARLLCTAEWAPVCGINGITYGNECELGSVKKAYDGECKSRDCEVCTKEYNPHCGSDGKTYGNACEFRCAQKENPKLTLIGLGRCQPADRNCGCNKSLFPVCGTDGRTYANPCLLECAQKTYPLLEHDHDGECSCICPLNIQPVCGTDGKTYDNLCRLRCAERQNPNITLAYQGKCNEGGCLCTQEYNPVCGSDGITYGNPCMFRCAQRKNPDLKVAYVGECRKEEICKCPFSVNVDEHCGTDGTTYQNRCNFDCAQRQNSDLKLHTKEPCLPGRDWCDCLFAPRDPICGTDGRTYVNPCDLNCTTATYPQLRMAHEGPCYENIPPPKPCNVPCPKIPLNPVCSSANVTYNNICDLTCQQITNPDVKLGYEGQCTDPCICAPIFNVTEHCGTDGITYPSLCHFKCAQSKNPHIKLHHVGHCVRADINCDCSEGPSDAVELCGSDGRNCASQCQLDCARKTYPQLYPAHDGFCDRSVTPPTNCSCPFGIINAVCGTDGTTYPTYCLLECAQRDVPDIKLDHDGRCRSVDNCVCPAHVDPVCGTDGVTYGNACNLGCAIRKDPTLKLDYKGRCKYQINNCNCPRVLNVTEHCGNDGATYASICHLQCAQVDNPDIKLLRLGPCSRAIPDCPCNKISDAVELCGSDGRNYVDQCELDCAKISYPQLESRHDGFCHRNLAPPTNCSCPLGRSFPVCGTDALTYPTYCDLECAEAINSDLKLSHNGTCRPDEDKCICPYNLDPVCGSDGVIYPNMCALRCEQRKNLNLKLAYRGECRNDTCTVCTAELNPHCGSDGKTYGNRCEFRCAQIKNSNLALISMGRCRAVEDNCRCPPDYDPVCGTDGRSYRHPCKLACAKRTYPLLNRYHDGECSCVCPNQFDYVPHCGTDGITYPNLCRLGCAELQNPDVMKSHNNVCQTRGNCTCPQNLDPVCAINGVTYGNNCEFECVQKIYPQLKIDHRGECNKDEPEKPCICTRERVPYCGSDGVTYGNLCEFRCAQRKNPDLKLAHIGECKKVEVCNCPLGIDPYCGTDGTTYLNLCNFECAQRQNPTIKLHNKGHCQPQPTANCNCPRILDPVCGTDGRNYPNDCVLNCAKVTYPQLRIAHKGRCNDNVPPQTPCLVPCPAITPLPLVCSSTNVTYTICSFACQQITNPDVKLGHDGECKAKEEECLCTGVDMFPNPICGTDGVTYKSPCDFGCAQRKNPDLQIAYNGTCKSCGCPQFVSAEHCGSDGTTYASLCHLECAQKDNPRIKLHHLGSCPRGDINCTCGVSDAEEICGSDGRNYASQCHLDCATKTYPHLVPRHDGFCHWNSPPPPNCRCLPGRFFFTCGTDGTTYPTYCDFECAQAANSDLQLSHDGRCRPDEKPCVCTEELNPVCGTDGVTYDNHCLLECAQQKNPDLKLAHIGECRKEICSCPFSIGVDPYCGSDGTTYQNRCNFECAQRQNPAIKLHNKGHCRPEPSTNCNCTFLLAPVCGTDGGNYPSECLLNCAKLTYPQLRVAHEGRCYEDIPPKPCQVPCPAVAPLPTVCSSANVTYTICSFACQQVTNPDVKLGHAGPCTNAPEPEPCRCDNPLNVTAHCGSDGTTYPTLCHLRCAQRQNPALKLKNVGHCAPPPIRCECLEIPETVLCGTDGRTYSSRCSLTCARGRYPQLEIAHLGPCLITKSPPFCGCPLILTPLNPVCSSANTTYECYGTLLCHQRNNPDIKLGHDGRCTLEEEPCICTLEYNPVCGSDGITYGNPCQLRCAQRKNPDLKLAHIGECKKQEMCGCPAGIVDPQCGTDGTTYPEQCSFECAQKQNPALKLNNKGPCGPAKPNLCDCGNAPAFVCGTDGRTYRNSCRLNCARATYSQLRMAHEGRCYDIPPPKSCNVPCLRVPQYPVCSAANVTYKGICELACHQTTNPDIKLAHDGQCTDDPYPEPRSATCRCSTPLNVTAHCGSDGTTYPSLCHLQCAQLDNPAIKLKNVGHCAPPPTNCICLSLPVEPLCGTDGRTYSSRCLLTCARGPYPQLEIAHTGPCRKSTPVGCGCPKIPINPVCSSANSTYQCYGALACHQRENSDIKLGHNGECTRDTEPDLPKPCKCDLIVNVTPHCGSDGVTYPDLCSFQCAQRQNPALKLNRVGHCLPPTISCWCPENPPQICGKDGRTYFSNCSFLCAKNYTYPQLEIAHEGPCRKTPPPPPCSCPQPGIINPVCSSANSTYESYCDLLCHQKENSDVKLGHDGKCTKDSEPDPPKPCQCDSVLNVTPHCGSDGITYPDLCNFQCAQSQNPALKLNRVGHCIPSTAICWCPIRPPQICGKDGRTYRSQCDFSCAKVVNYPELEIAHEGPCRRTPPPPTCSCPLPSNIRSVCSAANSTYDCYSALLCHQKENSDVKLGHDGICRKEPEPDKPESCKCGPVLNVTAHCGSDGVTYPDLCNFQCAQRKNPALKLHTFGHCVASNAICLCPIDPPEMCGKDGRTYRSWCDLSCAKTATYPELELAHEGPCRTTPPPQRCPCPFINPVFSVANSTYNSYCDLLCHQKENPDVKLGHKGKCPVPDTRPKPCTCPQVLNVTAHCGSDGVTYPDLCNFQCAQRQNPALKLNRVGHCIASKANCYCAIDPFQVCGKDGRTYLSHCDFGCAKSRTYPELEIAHEGPCNVYTGLPIKCLCPNTSPLNPVCSSANTTYSSYCDLLCYQNQTPDIKLGHDGKCTNDPEPGSCACPFIWDPVCGNDGLTYPNPCVLACYQKTNPKLQMVYRGECIPGFNNRKQSAPLPNRLLPRPRRPQACTCPHNWDPVCGTDGHTFANLCLLECNSGVKLAHHGVCWH